MRPLLCALLALVLGGCSVTGAERIGEGSQHHDVFRVHINLVAPENLTATCNQLSTRYGGAKAARFAGCSFDGVGSDGARECFIYAAAPHRLDDDKTLTLGHELWHCARGDFHG
jgi:hypothetical protein